MFKKLLVVLGALTLLGAVAQMVDSVIYQVRHRDDLFRGPIRIQMGPPTIKSTLRNTFPGVTELFEEAKS